MPVHRLMYQRGAIPQWPQYPRIKDEVRYAQNAVFAQVPQWGKETQITFFSGLLEMDEGYWGSRRSGKRGRGTSQKKLAVGLSKTGEKEVPMFLRMQEVPNIQRKTLQEFVNAHIQNGATIECDGFKSYMRLNHVAVDAKVYDCAADNLKWLHKALSNLKAFLTGTYHGRCENLQSYLNEYCFRFNRRHSTDQLFARLTRAVAVSAIADESRYAHNIIFY